MNAIISRIPAGLILSLAFTASAHAEYRCDPAPTWIDQRACKAAEESPQALRRFVQRMRWFTNLQFEDYVNHNTVLAWESKKRELAAQQEAEDSVLIVADGDQG
jgi:hypothetical protein